MISSERPSFVIRKTPPGTTLVVAAAIYSGPRVLLVQRKPKRHGLDPFSWMFCSAGGKVEAGEDLLEALFRELGEELKLSVSMTASMPILYDHLIAGPTRLRVICVRLDVSETIGEPHVGDGLIGFAWFGESEVFSLPLTPADDANRRALIAGVDPAAVLPITLARLNTAIMG